MLGSMKTKAYIEKHLQGLPFNPDAERYLGDIEANYPHDFSTSGRGYFSLEDEEAIKTKAFQTAQQHLQQMPAPITAENLRQCWAEIVTDFHRQNFWGFHTQMQKPAKVLTEEQKTYREMWPYIWVMIQSGIILKTAVYYFGIRSSSDPSAENNIYLVLALATSAGTLIFFAWRKSRK